ncbi:MAG TPA: hypothetical protein VGQ08_15785 [Nitrospiraceae bacterium]|jgi:hypothetical protein|nr:hypothetical protein [Nitrospiraceae bacterium]
MPNKLNHAGGYRILFGSPKARNFKARHRKPWIAATRSSIKRKVKLNDWATKLMLAEATRDFVASLATDPQEPGKHGRPLDRAHDIIGWIIQQGRFSAVDILTVALATHCMCKHWSETPNRTPYYVAVQIGKAIHKMLKSQVRVYEHDDGRGNVWSETVRYKKALTSRYVCQRLQQLCENIYGDHLRDHGHAIASQVARSQFMKEARSGSRIFQSSTL